MYNKKGSNPNNEMANAAQALLEDILNQTGEYLSQVFDLGDGYSASALDYAMNEIKKLYIPVDDSTGEYYNDFYSDTTHFNGEVGEENASKYIGWANTEYQCGWGYHRSKNRVSIGNMLQAYLTYFADFINGVSTTDINGIDKYYVEKGNLANSSLVTDDSSYIYTWLTGTTVSSDDLAQATFYDALFNQLCANGWTENDEVTDSSYLQEMLQSGMLYISKVKDDGYYYQGNYATDPYIKEISDETLIAQVEAKYTTEKAKLNTKEETLDMKMKNLDTEISSLTTEYDTVKNTISKNIEKSFKRYNA